MCILDKCSPACKHLVLCYCKDSLKILDREALLLSAQLRRKRGGRPSDPLALAALSFDSMLLTACLDTGWKLSSPELNTVVLAFQDVQGQ